MPSTRSTSERIPIWIADYVLMTYGTGAIMAVPAHDERDFAFAAQVRPADPAGDRQPARRLAGDGAAMEARPSSDGVMINSGPFDGTPADQAIAKRHRGLARGEGHWARARSTTACATG